MPSSPRSTKQLRSRCRAGRRSPPRAGATILLMVLLLVVILAATAFAVDVGLMGLMRAETQSAVDAGALVAVLTLQQNPKATAEAETAARQYVQRNCRGMMLRVPDDYISVERGFFNDATREFTAGGKSPNAVRVFARPERQPFYFAQIFGAGTFDTPASAVAISHSQPMDIMLVLDLSGSMANEGRIEALRNAAPVFVDMIEGMGGDDQVGVMGLSANPDEYQDRRGNPRGPLYRSGMHPTADHNVGVLESVLTDNFGFLKSQILSPSNLVAGKYTQFTGTGAALGDAAHYLIHGAQTREDVGRAIVLMSDGHANRPTKRGPEYAMAMARYAAAKKIAVYTLSLGNEADLGLMEDIASMTDGAHFEATGAGERQLTERLTRAFQDIATTLKRARLAK